MVLDGCGGVKMVFEQTEFSLSFVPRGQGV